MFYTQSTSTVISRWKKKEGNAGKQKPKQNMKQLPESVAVYPRQGREQGSGREWPAPCPAAAAGGHPLSSVASGTARHSSPLHPQSHVAALTCTSVRPVCRHMNYTNRGRKGLKEWSTLSLPIHVDADKKITKYTLHNCFRKLQHLGKIRKTCIYIYLYHEPSLFNHLPGCQYVLKVKQLVITNVAEYLSSFEMVQSCSCRK